MRDGEQAEESEVRWVVCEDICGENEEEENKDV